MQMGGHVTERLFSIYFMVNCYTCVCGNKTSTKYRIPTPTIENYLDVTMENAYDGDDLDELMIERLETQVEEQVEEQMYKISLLNYGCIVIEYIKI